MGRDRSLEEFFDATSEGSAASGSDGDDRNPEPKLDANGASESEAEAESGSESDTGGREPEADDAPPGPPDDVEPAAVTYRWDPSNVECAECGAAVDQLWSGESGQVCAECKEW